MSRYDKQRFPLLDAHTSSDGKPYDTHHLRSFHDAGASLAKYGRSTHTHCFAVPQNVGTSNTEYHQTKPICSVNGRAAILMYPIYIHRGLQRLRITHDVRVGFGDPLGAHKEPPAHRIGAGLLRAGEVDDMDVLPSLDTSSGEWEWQVVSHDFHVEGVSPGWDYLYIWTRSRVHRSVTDPSEWAVDWSDGEMVALDHPEPYIAGDPKWIRPGTRARSVVIHPDVDGIYGQTGGATSPEHDGNEITASVLVQARGTVPTFFDVPGITVHDHVRHRTDRQMAIRPDSPHPVVPDPDDYDSSQTFTAMVAKAYATYGQWRSITVEEIYDAPDQPDTDDLRSHALSGAKSYRSLRQNLNSVAMGPRPLVTGTNGVLPDPEEYDLQSVEDNTKSAEGYGYRWWHPFVDGDDALSIHVPPTTGHAHRQKSAKLMLLGMYASRYSEGDSYQDLIKSGVKATINIGGKEIEDFPLVPLTEGSSPLLTQKRHLLENAVTPTTAGGLPTDGYSYDEGTMIFTDGSTPVMTSQELDVGVWESVEVQIGTESSALDIHLDTSSLDWADDGAGLQDDGNGNPDPQRCYLFLLGYSIYALPEGQIL